MLAQMRALTRSFFAKVLLALLILAFAIWGIQGVFDGMRNSNVAEVAGRPITAQELQREFDVALDTQRRELERRAQAGQQVPPMPTRAQLIEANAHMQVLESLIQREGMFAFAQRLGVQAADSEISEAIRQIPALRDEQNRFQETRYQQFLQQLGYSHAGFVELMRGNVAVQQALLALTSGVRAPRSYGALLLAYETETRTVSVAQLLDSQLPALPAPSEEQLRTLYGELRSTPQFAVPEYRSLTLVLADPAAFEARVQIPDADMRAEFNRRAGELGTPERRSFTIVTTQTEDEARTAAQRLARGEAGADVARAVGGQTLTYETQTQAEVPDAALSRAVFALPANAAPQVVRGSLAPFAAVRLIDVTPGVSARFEDFRGEIRDALAGERANELREEAIQTFIDAVGEGAAPAEAARTAGLQVIQVPSIDEQGRTPAGAPFDGAPITPALISAAFQANEGEDTDFVPISEGLEIFAHVEGVTPAAVRAFDAVRPVLAEEWSRRERERRLEAAGERILAAIANGATLAAAATAEHATITARSQRIDRNAGARTIPQIFSVRVGQAVKAVSGDARVLLVAQVEQIDAEDPADHAQEIDVARQQFQRPDLPVGLVQSLAQAVQAAAIASGNPTRNERLIDQTFPNPDQQREQEQ